MKLTWSLRELVATSKRNTDLNTETPSQKTDIDTCTGTGKHTQEHAHADSFGPAMAGTSSSREGSVRTSGNGEESVGSSNGGQRSFKTLGSRKRPAGS